MLGILCLIAVFFIWISLYDTHRFVVVKHEFSSRKIKKSQRFIMLSDLHGKQYGRKNQMLLEAIKQQEPEGIFLAGDMVTAEKMSDKKWEDIIDFLKELKENYPVYYAYGNHEQKLRQLFERYGDRYSEYEAKLESIGIEPMRNLHVSLPESGICVYGLEIGQDFFGRLKQKTMETEYIEELLGKKEENMYTVLLAHNPDYFERYAEWGAELVLSGHIHGGIMRLPFLGGVISPSLHFFPKYDGGLYHEKESTMVLGRGIGGHAPSIRIFNPGELIVLDLVPEQD